jgi:hypothetical protein
MILSLSSILCLFLTSTSVASEDIDFPSYQVYEFDVTRLAPNDTKSTLYDIKFAAKERALWIEGSDYDYRWLTIVPYDGIKRVIVNRARGNPFAKDTGSWIGKQLAKAGDVRGWFTIFYTDTKGRDKEVVLLAPVKGDGLLASLLSDKVGKLELAGEVTAVHEEPPLVKNAVPISSPPSTQAAAYPLPPGLSPRKLIDLMTVSDFRAAGLGKLTDDELAALDAWISRHLLTNR